MMKRDYGRTTITVPLELKERMKRARAHVNWSSVACEAFEQKLDELGPIEEITSVDAALARMKSLEKQDSSSEEDVSTNGKQAGIQWALNFARPSQLQRIEDFRNETPDIDWESFITSREGWIELAKCIEPNHGRRRGPGPRHKGLNPDDEWDDIDDRRPARNRRSRMGKGPGNGPGRERDVWRSILDRRPDHPRFFLGFAEGALEVWRQIKDQF